MGEILGVILGGAICIAGLWLHHWWAMRKENQDFEEKKQTIEASIAASIARFKARIERGDFGKRGG